MTIRTLVEAGAVINPVNARFMTPMKWAAALGHCEAMATLLELGAGVNFTGHEASARSLTYKLCD